jgi:hypothetical protein
MSPYASPASVIGDDIEEFVRRVERRAAGGQFAQIRIEARPQIYSAEDLGQTAARGLLSAAAQLV